jgi:hypothetical protein
MWTFLLVVNIIAFLYVFVKRFFFKRVSESYGSMWVVVDDKNEPTSTYMCSNKHVFNTEERNNTYWYMDDKVTEFRAICPECNEIDIPPLDA